VEEKKLAELILLKETGCVFPYPKYVSLQISSISFACSPFYSSSNSM
jgi:hypothetical protein